MINPSALVLRRSLSSGRALRGLVGLALSATSARNRKVYVAGE
jgi:hypothetical protein